MKPIILMISMVFLSVGCVPEDTYKMKYPQQEISYGASVPISFSESDKIATQDLQTPALNSRTPSAKPKLERKPLTQTMKFIGQENPKQGVKLVERKQ